MKRGELELPRFLEAALAGGHPWVYRDHVPKGFAARSGEVVLIRAGHFRGYALWDADGPIALRVYSSKEPPGADWVRETVERATAMRAAVRSQETTAYRWLFGEGDGLPGITVDRYGPFAVVVEYASGLERMSALVVDALRSDPGLEGVLRRSSGADRSSELVWGRAPPSDLVVLENGIRLHADLELGQKTGLFLDHRDNRAFIRRIARGRRVLNLFGYTGAFSLYAAVGGATEVTSVDVAAPAIEAARTNFRLNQLDDSAYEFVVADVFEYLEAARRQGRTWDLVICDPPSFARQKEQRQAALRAYEKLNAVGLQVTDVDGYYAAASCTSQVSPEVFRQTVALAAARASRRFQIVHEAGQPLDHPVFAQHSEGRYLKFLVGRALSSR